MRTRPSRPLLLGAAAGTVLLLAGCSTLPGAPITPPPANPLHGTVTVLAAASLATVFDALARDFERQHPGVTIAASYAGSSALVAQVTQGAPADILATANEGTMKTVTDAHLTDGRPTVFATNVLQLIVPPGNPARIKTIADLARPGVTVALCDKAVPCGSAAAALLTVENVAVKPVTLDQDVTSVLTRVELDEVDAGLVYVTDAKTAGLGVETIAVPDAANTVNRYPIAVLAGSTHRRASKAFEAFILSKTGRNALKRAGFGAP